MPVKGTLDIQSLFYELDHALCAALCFHATLVTNTRRAKGQRGTPLGTVLFLPSRTGGFAGGLPGFGGLEGRVGRCQEMEQPRTERRFFSTPQRGEYIEFSCGNGGQDGKVAHVFNPSDKVNLHCLKTSRMALRRLGQGSDVEGGEDLRLRRVERTGWISGK